MQLRCDRGRLQAELAQDVLIVLAERGRRGVDAGAAMGEAEGGHRYGEPALDAVRDYLRNGRPLLARPDTATSHWALFGFSTASALAFLTLFLFVPLISVFYEALRKGVGVYFASIVEPVCPHTVDLLLRRTPQHR